jgi:glucose-1-phosphate thymidylyltransferase
VHARGILILAGREAPSTSPFRLGMPAPFAPVGNRAIALHVVDALARAGARDIVAVGTPAMNVALRDALASARPAGLRVRDLPLDPWPGEGGAILAAAKRLPPGPLIVHDGDGLLGEPVTAAAAAVRRGSGVTLMVCPAQGTSSIELEHHRLLRLVDDGLPHDKMCVAGVYLFGADAVAQACCRLERDGADVGMADIVDDLRCAGSDIGVRVVGRWRRFSGDADQLLELNRLVLDELIASPAPDGGGNSVHGRVSIHPTAMVRDSVVRGPAVIGPGAVVDSAYIGPYTSIGASVRVEGSEIEDSIIQAGARVLHIGDRLEGSVVGRDATVHRGFRLPRALRLRVGDGVEVAIA